MGCTCMGCTCKGCTCMGCTCMGCTCMGCTCMGCTCKGCTCMGCTCKGCTCMGCTHAQAQVGVERLPAAPMPPGPGWPALGPFALAPPYTPKLPALGSCGSGILTIRLSRHEVNAAAQSAVFRDRRAKDDTACRNAGCAASSGALVLDGWAPAASGEVGLGTS